MAPTSEFEENGKTVDAQTESETILVTKVKMIDGLIARHEVGVVSGYPTEVSEKWLARKIGAGEIRAWCNPWFRNDDWVLDWCLDDPKLNGSTELDHFSRLSSAWRIDEICMVENEFRAVLADAFEKTPVPAAQDAGVGAEKASETQWRDMRPAVASHEPICEESDLTPRGTTWVDAEYDERLTEAVPEPMQASDKRFKTAVYEVHKASGMPLEIAEEALIEAVENRKVEAWKPFGLARSKLALRHLPSPVDPETRINGEQLNFWIKCTFGAQDHLTKPINVGPPPRECVPFEVARAMAAEASGYDVSAARSWLVDAILVNKRIPGWLKPTAEYPAWRNPNAGDDPSDLYVMTEVLKQALAVEFGQLGRVCQETGQSGAVVTHGRRSPRGRPPMEFWPSVSAEVGQWLRDEGGEGEPGAQARVAERLALAIANRGYEEPGETTLKKYARKVIDDIKADKGR